MRVPAGFEEEFPGASALATECFANIGLLTGTVQAALTRLLSELGIPSIGALNVLAIVDGDPDPLTPSTIAERMMVTRATITGLLDTLERRGFVRRSSDRHDARRKLVSLTPHASRTVRKVLPIVHDFERQLLDCLGEPQQRQLLGFVAVLERRILTMAPDVQPGVRE